MAGGHDGVRAVDDDAGDLPVARGINPFRHGNMNGLALTFQKPVPLCGRVMTKDRVVPAAQQCRPQF